MDRLRNLQSSIPTVQLRLHNNHKCRNPDCNTLFPNYMKKKVLLLLCQWTVSAHGASEK